MTWYIVLFLVFLLLCVLIGFVCVWDYRERRKGTKILGTVLGECPARIPGCRQYAIMYKVSGRQYQCMSPVLPGFYKKLKTGSKGPYILHKYQGNKKRASVYIATPVRSW